MPHEPIVIVPFSASTRNSLPGPSRTITVEPVEVPAGPPPPVHPSEPAPVEPMPDETPEPATLP